MRYFSSVLSVAFLFCLIGTTSFLSAVADETNEDAEDIAPPQPSADAVGAVDEEAKVAVQKMLVDIAEMKVDAPEFVKAVDLLLKAADAKKGIAVYEDYCAACHGYDGVNMLPQAPNFVEGSVFKTSDAQLFASVRDGRGDIMPPWSDDLSVEEMFAALKYAMRFGPPQETEATPESKSEEPDT